MALKIKSRGKTSESSSEARCAAAARHEPGQRTATAEKAAWGAEQGKPGCSGTAPMHSGERCLTHTQGPKTSQFLLNLKPTDCFDITGNTTWPGEGISLLAKKIHLYANSIFREENVLGNATVRDPPHPSWSA